MHKTFRVNEKRLSAKYNRRIFFFNIPSIAIIFSLLLIVVVFIILLDAEVPTVLYRAIFYVTYICIIYGFVTCLTGSVISAVKINAHNIHTYIEICDDIMIISEHYQTRLQNWKLIHYKKMWVVKLKDVTQITCEKSHLTILCTARYFNEPADWLGYEHDENGISFDNWWYDEHGGKKVETIDITDFYAYGERIAQRIALCSHKIKEREERREAFRREMLEIAKNADRTRGVRDKYKPPKKRVFRP